MKRQVLKGIAIIAIFILMPFVALKAKVDTERAFEKCKPDTRRYVIEILADRGHFDASYTPEREARQSEADAPEIDIDAQIAAINEGYFQMEENSVPAADSPVFYALSDGERDAIEQMVASEGGYCEYEFQALVAECILNGCIAEDMRPLEIFERGDFWLTHDVEPTETTKQAVSDVFDYGIFPTEEPVRYYYNPNYCSSAAHESKTYVLTCCDCRFFKD